MLMYIDVGSTTVKVYSCNANKRIVLINSKSFHFKNSFTPEEGISKDDKSNLINFINDVKKNNPDAKIKVFATAIFRQINKSARQKLIDDFFQATGLYFNVVPHDLEGFYNELALSGDYLGKIPILLMNIGGGSTELLIQKDRKTIVKYNLEIGVGTVLGGFPFLNDGFSRHKLATVVESIKENLPEIDMPTPFAVYNGGELTYMKLANYRLQDNTIFADNNHPNMVHSKDFAKRNREIFADVSISELEELMPENPAWMHGARACSALAQAIVEHFKVEKIIPSDSNMVHGIVKQEFRSVVISGSYRKHLDDVAEIKKNLEKDGVQVLSPRFHSPKNLGEEFIVFEGEENMSLLEIERFHLDMINKSDALIVCNPRGYVGPSALLEIGYANAIGKRIIFTEKPKEHILQTIPAEIGL